MAYISRFLVLGGLGLLVSCAHMESPPGGPADLTPPQLVGHYPPPNARNVPLNSKFIFEFSELMSNDWKNSSVIINPSLPRKFQFEYTGTQIRLVYPENLDTNTTYTLSLSPSITDFSKNKLQNPLPVVFSTGNRLDSTSLTVKISSPIPSGKMAYLALYPTDSFRTRALHLVKSRQPRFDSLPHPRSERPMYFIPLDSLGRGEFLNLRPGAYAAVAFIDQNSDLGLNLAGEELGIGPFHTPLNSDTPLYLALSVYDTLPPKVSKVSFIAERWAGNDSTYFSGYLDLSFSKDMDPATFSLAHLTILNRDSSNTLLPTQLIYKDISKSWQIYTPPLRKDSVYQLKISSGRDLMGDSLELTSRSLLFSIPSKPSDLSTKLQVVAPNLKQTALVLKEPIQISRDLSFTQADIDSIQFRLISLQDTLPLKPSKKDLNTLYLSIQDIRHVGQKILLQYRDLRKTNAELPNERVLSQAETSPKSTPNNQEFPSGQKNKTSNTRTELNQNLDSISSNLTPPQKDPFSTLAEMNLVADNAWGKIIWDQGDFRGKWEVKLTSLQGVSYTFSVPPVRTSVWDYLPEGKYILSYFLDVNQNKFWDKGKFSPWTPQEPMYQYPDTLEIKNATPQKIPLHWPPVVKK